MPENKWRRGLFCQPVSYKMSTHFLDLSVETRYIRPCLQYSSGSGRCQVFPIKSWGIKYQKVTKIPKYPIKL